jgi:hypothetical protein
VTALTLHLSRDVLEVLTIDDIGADGLLSELTGLEEAMEAIGDSQPVTVSDDDDRILKAGGHGTIVELRTIKRLISLTAVIIQVVGGEMSDRQPPMLSVVFSPGDELRH